VPDPPAGSLSESQTIMAPKAANFARQTLLAGVTAIKNWVGLYDRGTRLGDGPRAHGGLPRHEMNEH